ncbi:MAG: YhfC family intramembrane metalloprotease [Oscillospiraceae bacterium]|nr:YhfC family intramembrane metalloprotease [Oscillospiraceae bacterium]
MNIPVIVIYLASALIIPAAAYFIMKARPKPYFVGCGTFFVFALVLESAINAAMGMLFPKALENIWFYAVYGGLMAGVFEEVGRFIAFSTLLKKDLDNDRTALSYGAGHGGMEAFMVLTSVVLNIFIASTVTGEEYREAIDMYMSIGFSDALIAVVERLFAVAVHISLSVVVFFGAKKKKPAFLFLAIALHAVFDGAVVLINNFFGIIWAEVATAIMAAMLACFCYTLWKGAHERADIR